MLSFVFIYYSARRNSPIALLTAAHQAILELITTCEECELEIAQRIPKLTAHCRYAFGLLLGACCMCCSCYIVHSIIA